MDMLKSLSVVNAALFPAPPSSYTVNDFGRQLIWLPSEPETQTTTSSSSSTPPFFPCLFITFPGAEQVILYSHGNGEDIGNNRRVFETYASRWQVNVLGVEYPGYGLSNGKASEEGCNKHMRAAYDFLTNELHFEPRNVIVFGRSIGTGVATELVASLQDNDVTVGGLILKSPYLSVKTLAKSLVGSIAKLMVDRFENYRQIKKVRCPLMIVHGKQDQLIPYQHAEELIQLCEAEDKLLQLCPEADHNYFDIYQDEVIPIGNNFFNKIVQITNTDDERDMLDLVPTRFFEAPELVGTRKGVLSTILGTSVALTETSVALVCKDETVAVDATTVSGNGQDRGAGERLDA